MSTGFGTPAFRSPIARLAKNTRLRCGLVLLRLFVYAGNHSLAQFGNPALSVRQLPAGQIECSWPASATDFVLEQAEALFLAPAWHGVATAVKFRPDELFVTIEAGSGTQFLRLRQVPTTTLLSTSPFDGETGVAVTRETILHFSAPLSRDALLNTDHFYASFGGRRILSRVELSNDRTRATLFYLEPLPGSARVTVTLDGNTVNDASGVPLDADDDGSPGGQAVISFDTLSLSPLPGTAVVGRVFASELVPGTDTGTNAVNKPLAGVTITVDGMEQSLRAVTDALGNFTLDNCPSGRFFVHIDGRTAVDAAAGIHYPDQAYYPFVGKAWEAVAGVTNNLAGGTGTLFLPLITRGTLQPVNLTGDTVITFPPGVIASNPALLGVSITVPANSLYSDNGTRGGKVGIAPVPPDRLPGPLPPGLELSIVITVQTDGPLNFDKPAPICFPNLPDPVLKVPLPAGSKQALISFNHKKGIWEAVGSMTVSADGKFICTDPGMGILQPGWHGVGPTPDDPPPCTELCCDGGGGGGPLTPFSLAGGNRPAGGRGRKAGSGPSSCKKPCPFKKFDECIHMCAVESEQCRRFLLRAELRCEKVGTPSDCYCGDQCVNGSCHGVYLCSTGDQGPNCKEHLAKCQREKLILGRLCSSAFQECIARCKNECPGVLAVAGRLGKAGLADGFVVDQITEKFDAASALLIPYLAPGAAIPQDVGEQVNVLYLEADALSGGNVLEFLDRYLAEQDQELAVSDAEFGEDPGNAPPYPVLFAAKIARPTGILTLRGETGPFGQYSIFIPRDGELLFVSFYDPRTKQFGIAFPHLRAIAAHRMPRFNFHSLDESFVDSDHDGLPDAVEFVYGTDETNPDSDGDGILDGAEIEQGTNPLDGVPVRIGIVATATTPGPAVDVAAGNDLLAVAEGASGVSVFKIGKGIDPVLVAHIDTPGQAQSVAISGNLVAVADGDQGLAVIDVSDPANATIVRQVPLHVIAQKVAVAGNFAYITVGHRLTGGSSTLVKVDLTNGTLFEDLPFADPLDDVAVAGDQLYLLTRLGLKIYSDASGTLALMGSVTFPEVVSPIESGRRLFVGGGLAYVGYLAGHLAIDVRNPAQPVVVGVPPAAQLGLHDTTATGSGLLVATTGSAFPNPRQVALYDASQPNDVTKFLTLFDTPGEAMAITIHNGLAYVADNAAGIQVVNYLAADKNALAPVISLSTSAAGGVAEASKVLRLTAHATDDVQVRNVEFYVDGARVIADGNFPFEYRFVPPAPTASKTRFKLRARAVDTGGNATWSDELTLTLGPDSTRPRVVAATPQVGNRTVNHVEAVFSESLNAASVSRASFRLILAGPDGALDTVDDVPINGGVVTYHSDLKSAALDFAAPLPEGRYRATITSAVSDIAGNHLASDFAWEFGVADAVFWLSATDGAWEDAENWSGGAVPGPDDNVILDVAGADVSITHGTGTHSVKNLTMNEHLRISGVLHVGGIATINEQMEIRFGVLEAPGGITLNAPLTLNAGKITGGTVTENGAARLKFTDEPANVLDGVMVHGDLDLTNPGARLLIHNGLTVSGEVLIDGGGIGFEGNQTFDHATVVFKGTSGYLTAGGKTTLTLGPALVVRGNSGSLAQGVFLGDNDKIVNQGLISADVAGGTLFIGATQFENQGRIQAKEGGSLTIGAFNWTNGDTGAIDASGGGALALSGTWQNLGTITANGIPVALGGTFKLADLGIFNRTGGTVAVVGTTDLAGGTLTLNSVSGSWTLQGGTIKGGAVSQSGGARLIISGNTANTFDGVSVKGDLTLTDPGARLLIRNGLTLTGRVLLGNSGGISFVGDQVFNTGSVEFVGGSGFLAAGGNTMLTLGPAMVVRGKTGSLAQGVFLGSNDGIINQGLISADVAGETLTINQSVFTNAGILRASNGGTLKISAFQFIDNGTREELNGGKIIIGP